MVASALCAQLTSSQDPPQSSSATENETQSKPDWSSPLAWIEYRATNGLQQQFAVTSARVLPHDESAKLAP